MNPFDEKLLYSGFRCYALDETRQLFAGTLPAHLMFSEGQFEEFWNEHPNEFHEIKMHGRPVKTPRWQQAYGKDYHYTGNVNGALAVPQRLESLLRYRRRHCSESPGPARRFRARCASRESSVTFDDSASRWTRIPNCERTRLVCRIPQ